MLSKPEQNLIKIYENSFRQNWTLEAVTDYGTTNTLTTRSWRKILLNYICFSIKQVSKKVTRLP